MTKMGLWDRIKTLWTGKGDEAEDAPGGGGDPRAGGGDAAAAPGDVADDVAVFPRPPKIPGWPGPQTRDPQLYRDVCELMSTVYGGDFDPELFASKRFQRALDELEAERAFPDAVEVLRRAMVKLPEHPPVWRRLARIYTETYDNTSARALWERLAEVRHRPAEANFYLGELAEREEKMPEAAAYYQRALAFDVGYTNAWTRAEKLKAHLPMPRKGAMATVGGVTQGGVGGDPGAGVGVRPPPGFELKHPLGRGGYGTVYLARDGRLHRDVAIKFLHPHLTRDGRRVEAFFNEARLVARLALPGVVRIYDLNPERRVIIMEYLTRGTLRDRLASGRPLTPKAALRVAAALLKTLARLHAQSLIHRDIKPENILFRSDNSAVLGDFGVATLEDSDGVGRAAGTLAYMAPEQKRPSPEAIDRRVDLYAVGLVLAEMLSGALPAPLPGRARPPQAYIDLLPRAAQPHLLAPILNRLLAIDPNDRPSDALSVYQDLVVVYRELGNLERGRELLLELDKLANLSGPPDAVTRAYLDEVRREVLGDAPQDGLVDVF